LCLKPSSSFQEKSSDFDRKEDFTSDLKKDWRFKEALRIKGSKAKQNNGQHVQHRRRDGSATGLTAVHPGPSTTGLPEKWHGLAVLGGTTMPPGTAVPGLADAWPCSFAIFDLFIRVFASYFGELSRLLSKHFLG